MPLDLATADQESGDTTVRLLDDMVQQQDSQGQWIDICTIQEFEQSDPVSAGRQKMEEIVRQHQEAETNGTDEENGGFSGFFEEGEWTCGCDPANYGGQKKVPVRIRVQMVTQITRRTKETIIARL